MDTFLISALTGVFIFVLIDAIEGMILGDRGKHDNITNYFNYLSGKQINKQKTKKFENVTKSDRKKTVGNYYLYSVVISICIFFISVIAFKSLFLAFLLSLSGLVYPKIMMDNAYRKRKEKLNLQFRDALNSIMGSLKAGLSINSAIVKCFDDLQKVYSHQKEKYMVEEFKKIKNDLSIGISVDDALRKFKQRLGMEDVDDFVNAVIIVRQKGGNMLEIMENVTKMISDKITVKNEIKVVTAQKKYEARILTIVPVLLVILLSIFSPEYMKPLYGTVLGKILIVLGFVLLILNYFVGKKVTDINV